MVQTSERLIGRDDSYENREYPPYGYEQNQRVMDGLQIARDRGLLHDYHVHENNVRTESYDEGNLYRVRKKCQLRIHNIFSPHMKLIVNVIRTLLRPIVDFQEPLVHLQDASRRPLNT